MPTDTHTPDTPAPGPRKPQAATLPPGTVITTGPSVLVPDGPTVLTRIDKPGRCPWRIGGPSSKRYAATWRAQDLINGGATVTRPAQAGVKRRTR